MKPRVKHKDEQYEPNDIYIGRPSIWGNQFVIGRDGSREEVIKKHANSIPPELKKRAKRELFGKNLVCWCTPLPCHGDTWLVIANEEPT